MHVMVIGSAGMLGRKLVDQICQNGELAGKKITSMSLVDIANSEFQETGWPVSNIVGDLSDSSFSERLIDSKPDCIFNLAAIVSGEAESDFSKGYSVNLDGFRNLLETIRFKGCRPKVVFASSIAVFGGPFPEEINDDYFAMPLTSYGVQKACCELLLTDYSRKGFLDGIAIRLPTVVVRPGSPNKAASGFFSNILREPLSGKQAILPVSEDVTHWIASPPAAVSYLIRAAEIDSELLGPRKAVTMPGISVSVSEMIQALENVAGRERADLIIKKRDEDIVRIVDNWPRKFSARRALELGFAADESIEAIIQKHIDGELGGKLVPIE